MKVKILISLIILSIVACQPAKKNEQATSEPQQAAIPQLTKLWETDTVLSASESVIYDNENEVLYVSCINGVPPTDKDNDGFIAKVALDGTILDKYWVRDIDAPKGMGILAKSLFVTNIDEIREYKLPEGDLLNTYKIDTAKFLNDITTFYDGDTSGLYISDMGADAIYLLRDGQVSLFIQDSALSGPNGLLYQGQDLFAASYNSGKIHRIDIPTKKIYALSDTVPSGDGIVAYDTDFLVSSWTAAVYHISRQGGKTLLLDSTDFKNSADIWIEGAPYLDYNLLLVPTFFGNTVAAYKVK